MFLIFASLWTFSNLSFSQKLSFEACSHALHRKWHISYRELFCVSIDYLDWDRRVSVNVGRKENTFKILYSRLLKHRQSVLWINSFLQVSQILGTSCWFSKAYIKFECKMYNGEKTIGISLTFFGERKIESIHINHHHFVHSQEALQLSHILTG